ncbi:FAD-dependent monooxygenase [Subtercola endophyticus]|uniref:FAD-dependent monooxygenase n=1 Tax=Subtercola endophyticus TaxID=2895559 RepID=UPI001E2C4FF5|nr:FAD-dependent monooxygenase [Subtercola endophyticus]UFS60569.1 FAD-dependent monooxygenase [Subtercola endophyticus]
MAIVGAGPTGMMLAAELALAGVDVRLLERRPTQQLAGSRAGGLQSRTIEVFDQRGIADRFLEAGTTAQVQRFGEVTLDISDFPTRHPYGLGLWQNRIEAILAEWIRELGVSVEYGCEVTGVEADDTGVTVRVAGGHPDVAGDAPGPMKDSAKALGDDDVRAQYVVGCDGGRSAVRKAAGIAFEGWEATVSNLVAEVEYGVEPERGMRKDKDGGGSNGIGPIEKGSSTIRVVVTENELKPGAAEPTLADLSEAMVAVWGTDFGVHSPTWISRFTDAARQAVAYRAGRILLAGDAAHVHYPAGGQGLNIGVQDAVNLGWKLAQVVAGVSPASLLDTYEAERHPVAAQVLQDTLAQVGLRRADARSKAVASAVADLLSLDQARKHVGARLSGLGVHYDLGPEASAAGAAEHPLLGRRMPDLDLLVEARPLRASELLHDARPVLLDFSRAFVGDLVSEWSSRVKIVRATCAGPWELPEIGAVPAPTAVLVRPDGYVAWVGSTGADANVDSDAHTDADVVAELIEALIRWVGRP